MLSVATYGTLRIQLNTPEHHVCFGYQLHSNIKYY